MLKKVLILTVLLLSASVSYADMPSEDDVKAAFIFHFINFTQWEDNEPQYYVCIPEDLSLRTTARNIFKDKIVKGRKVVVVDRREDCHVLVSDKVPTTHSTLTIGALDKGALIEFRTQSNKLKFAISMNNIKDSNLKISSQLLKLGIPE